MRNLSVCGLLASFAIFVLPACSSDDSSTGSGSGAAGSSTASGGAAGSSSGAGGAAAGSSATGGAAGAAGGSGSSTLDCDGTCNKLKEKQDALVSELACTPDPDPISKCVETCKMVPEKCAAGFLAYSNCVNGAPSTDFECDPEGGADTKMGVCQSDFDTLMKCLTGM